MYDGGLGEMMYELKDYLKAINETKLALLDTDDIMWEKKYPTFIINRCLSMFYDTIMHSNEMNGLHFLLLLSVCNFTIL